MLTIVSDTHGSTGHRLAGRTLEAVRGAELVVHAGDFTTESVYDAFEAEATELVAVAGNNEDPALVERLPTIATVEWEDTRFLVVHGHEQTETGLSMLARQEEADVVVVGHSHRPELSAMGEFVLVNPGSHADPRRFRPGHVEVEATARRLVIRLREPSGAVIEAVSRTR